MTSPPTLDHLTPEQLRALAAQLLQRVSVLDEQVETVGKTVQVMDKKIRHDKTLVEKLSHEIAQLKRFKFAKRSEQMSPEQASLLDDLIDTDIAAIEAELQALQTVITPTEKKQKPKRNALPADFPRTLIHHEPDNTHCLCGCALKRIGEDVSEKLDYTPGVFTVECHVRGKWVCDDCETLIQGTDSGASHRQGHPDSRAASPRHDRQVCRPSAALPSGVDFRSSWLGDSTFNFGSMGLGDWGSVAASGRCTA
jgi:hypothetical protein